MVYVVLRNYDYGYEGIETELAKVFRSLTDAENYVKANTDGDTYESYTIIGTEVE